MRAIMKMVCHVSKKKFWELLRNPLTNCESHFAQYNMSPWQRKIRKLPKALHLYWCRKIFSTIFSLFNFISRNFQIELFKRIFGFLIFYPSFKRSFSSFKNIFLDFFYCLNWKKLVTNLVQTEIRRDHTLCDDLIVALIP